MTRDRNQFQMCSQRKKDIGQDKGKSEDPRGSRGLARLCSWDSVPLPLGSALSTLVLLSGKVSATDAMAALHTGLLHLAFPGTSTASSGVSVLLSLGAFSGYRNNCSP